MICGWPPMVSSWGLPTSNQMVRSSPLGYHFLTGPKGIQLFLLVKCSVLPRPARVSHWAVSVREWMSCVQQPPSCKHMPSTRQRRGLCGGPGGKPDPHSDAQAQRPQRRRQGRNHFSVSRSLLPQFSPHPGNAAEHILCAVS